MRRTSGTFGPVFLKQNFNLFIFLLIYSIKLMIISHTIKFGSREWRINVKNRCFLERSNRVNVFVSLLSSIDLQCYDHLVSYVTTTFVSHNVL